VKNIYVNLTPEMEEKIEKIKAKSNYQSDEELYQHLILIGLDKAKEREGERYGMSDVCKNAEA